MAGACPEARHITSRRPRRHGPSYCVSIARTWPDDGREGRSGRLRLLRLRLRDQLAVDLLGAVISGAVGHPPSIIDEHGLGFEKLELEHEIDVRADEQIGRGEMVGGDIVLAG